jgi:predicted RND superfamily exporter protein
MYSAIGSMIAFVVVLYGLPSLLGYLPMKAARGGEEEGSSKTWERIAGFLVRKHGLVSATCVAGALACSAGLQWFQTETKAIRYFPETSRVVQDYRFIEENIGGVIPIDIVVRFPKELLASDGGDLLFAERQEIVRRVQNKLVEQHSDISGAISLATFRQQSSSEELAARKANGLQRRLDLTTQQKVTQDGSSGRNFVKHADESVVLEQTGETLCVAGDELWRITAQVNIMTKTDYSKLTADIEEIIASETKNITGVSQVVTGMVPLFLETQRAILSSMISSFWVAFLTIWITMAIVVRNPLAGFIAMIPNALPVSIVFGLVSWFGIAIDVGTMITASVALGISVDGSIHMLAWFQEAVKRGRTRRVAVVEALGHCGPAMCQTGFVVGFGLLVLFPAELTLISRFGVLMAAMVAAALLGTVVWLPALMGGWLGSAVLRQTAYSKPLGKPTAETKPEVPFVAPTIQPVAGESSASSTRSQTVREPHFVKSGTVQSTPSDQR